MMGKEKEALWAERVAAWKASGASMRCFAMKHGWPPRQMAYWKKRLADGLGCGAALVPVEVKRAQVQGSETSGTIKLMAPGWALELPGATPASWLAELLRSL